MGTVVYSAGVTQFSRDVRGHCVAEKMEEGAREAGIYPSHSELCAWRNNAPQIDMLLQESGVRDCQVVFEYVIPYHRSRIDCMLYGRGEDGAENVVHIELKQWSNEGVRPAESDGNFQVTDEEGDAVVLAFTGGRFRQEAHPSQQVRGYDDYLRNFLEVFEDEECRLKGFAYCYNYHRRGTQKPTELFQPKFQELLQAYRTYAGDESAEVAEELRKLLCNGDGLSIFNKVIDSPIRPSRKLLDEAAAMVDQGDTSAFSLIGDQIVARNAILDRIRKNSGKKTAMKTVVLVRGGPGTGKTVIALHVLAELAKNTARPLNIRYVTKSKPLTEGVKHQLARGSRAKHLFVSFGQFLPAKCKADEFDVLLVDEAHRMQENANGQYTPRAMRTDMTMVDTILRAAKTCVFFIDDKQAIRSMDNGSSERIRASASKYGAHVEEVELKSQFRCNGADNYLDWLEELLYGKESNIRFKKSEYDFRVFDSPSALYKAICSKNKLERKQTARLMAGFCWPWSDQLGDDGDLRKEVRIGPDFAMPWETKDAIENPPAKYVKWFEWAYKPAGIQQVGCIYTAQGFEFDYAGVIIGPDLKYDVSRGGIFTDVRETKDPTLRRGRADFDRYCRNIYRVLMSRGMKGCYVYCCDEALGEYLKTRLALAQGTEETPKRGLEILADVEEDEKFVTCLPVYSLKVACGKFGEGEDVEPMGWLPVSGRLDSTMFVAKAMGHSMEPQIQDGAWCVFRAGSAGTRAGKKVLVMHREIYDPDTGGAFTLKQYASEKCVTEDGGWEHTEIRLKPLNPEFEDIVIRHAEEGEFKVVAEFLRIAE